MSRLINISRLANSRADASSFFLPADWSPVCGDQITLYNEVRDLRRGRLTETADAGATPVQLHATSGHRSMQSSEPCLVPTMDQADEAIRKREQMRARRKRDEN